MTDRELMVQALKALEVATTPLAKDRQEVLLAQAALRERLAHPAPQTCSCRWDGDTQVQQCALHQAHVDAIHEWAERAKAAEAKLKAQQQQQEQGDSNCQDDDGCPTEMAVLQRFWRGEPIPTEHYPAWFRPAQQQEPVAVARVDDLERGGRVRALAMGLSLDAPLYTAPQPSKPHGFAGVTAWIGDATVTRIVTQVQIQHERVAGQSMKQTAQVCLDMLAAHGSKENT